MKFKVGDKVRVKSLEEIKNLPNHITKINNVVEGSCEDTDIFGNVITAYNSFVDSMFKFCGKEFVIEQAGDNGNYLLANTCRWGFIACWLERAPHYVDSFDEE